MRDATAGYDDARGRRDPAAAPHPAVIEFADGSGVAATLSPLADGALELAVDTYVTHARHAVAARCWHLRAVDAARAGWRVERRLPAI